MKELSKEKKFTETGNDSTKDGSKKKKKKKKHGRQNFLNTRARAGGALLPTPPLRDENPFAGPAEGLQQHKVACHFYK